ncbi:amino acid adenylation domain-containing protein [Streptomyces sp. YH02]|uniref:amino acid adenylation domain-containing protein n=1 Tax=Streptomyces sp. YH02 TaxID=3256999 RepID=UPI003756BD76
MTTAPSQRRSRPLSDAQRQLLADRVKAARSAPTRHIPSFPKETPAPASFAQERLWLIDRLNEHGHAYNVYHVLRIRGAVDVAVLRGALTALVARHETLRTFIVPGEPVPVQLVRPAGPVELAQLDLCGTPETDRPALLNGRILEVCREPFDLAGGPLLRAELIRCAANEQVLVLALPHIATDGWSTAILAKDLTALYAGAVMPEPRLGYRDYAAWQRERLAGSALQAQLGHWRQALADQPQVLNLFTDRPRPAVQQFEGANRRRELTEELTQRLRELAARCETSLYTLLVAAVRVLLHAHSGQNRFILASTIAGRDHPELDDIVGCFINTLALGGDLSGDPSFAVALDRERETVLQAFAHAELPFELLVRDLVGERDASRNPLSQVFVQLDRGDSEGWTLPGLEVEELQVAGDVAKFDLSFFFRDRGGRLSLNLEYATALFDAVTADRLADRLVELLASAVATPEAPLSELSLLPSGERRQLLVKWNDTATEHTARLLPTLITERATAIGDHPAVLFQDRVLTYSELETRANRLAHYLQSNGVGRGDLVAVFLDRGFDLPVALLAVLKAGAAYVPLNSGEPADRIELILQDARPALVITEGPLQGQLPVGTADVHRLDELGEALAALSQAPPAVVTDPADLAYVIFTSGSTGRPKGVAVPHGALANFLASMAKRPGLTSDDVLIAVTTPSFDIAALELFLPLIVGGRLVIAHRDTTVDGNRLRKLITDTGATILQATPATWRLLQDAPELSQLTALVGGEALTPDIAAPLVQSAAAVWNMYGPTETTIWSAVRRIGPEDLDRTGPLPIGRPIGNTSCHILDEHGRPTPIGVPGELFIGGQGVAQGYYGRPTLTAERFVPDPFGPPGARLYRTGDMARYLSDGDIEFLGRNDHQVKVRGYRIETSEIEAHLSEQPSVRQAVVTAHEFGPGDRRLVAYLTVGTGAHAGTGTAPGPAELRAHLAGKLPGYMIPGIYVVLDEFPLTPNRKVDRKALPAPQAKAAAAGDQAPRTASERLVAGVWADVLGAAVPGVHADFFGLGGHSLIAVNAMNQLNSMLGTTVDVRAIFDAPTVAGLAARLDTAVERPAPPEEIPRSPRDRALRPSFAQERMWFLEQMNPGSPEYHIPLELALSGPLDTEALRAALQAVVERHEALRTRLQITAGGDLLAVIEPAGEFELPLDDLSGAADAVARAESLAAAESAAAFDLSADQLLRARLIRLSRTEHLLVITMHHAAADGTSIDILRRELARGYRAARRGERPDSTEPPVQYADVADWQRQRLSGTGAQDELAYWRGQLTGLTPLELPTDRPRPAVRRTDGAAYRFAFPQEVADQVESLARAHCTTPFTVLVAAFQAALGSWAGRGDVAVATPVSNRTGSRTQDLIGMFVNTLVLRADLSDDPTFATLVARSKERVAGALAHQNLPFEHVVDELAADRDPSRPALSPVYFALDTAPTEPWSLEGLRVDRRPERILAARYELTLGLARTDDGYQGLVEYSPVLFDPDTVAAFVGDFEELLRAVTADPVHRPGPFLPEPAPVGTAPAPAEVRCPGRPPAPGTEEAVARIWTEVLGIPIPDAYEDFFALGGHSLLAARVRLRLQADFGVDLPMHRLFEAATVAALATAVRQEIEAELAGMSEQELINSLEDAS